MKRYRNWLLQGGGVVALEPYQRLVMRKGSLHRLAMRGALSKRMQPAYWIETDWKEWAKAGGKTTSQSDIKRAVRQMVEAAEQSLWWLRN